MQRQAQRHCCQYGRGVVVVVAVVVGVGRAAPVHRGSEENEGVQTTDLNQNAQNSQALWLVCSLTQAAVGVGVIVDDVQLRETQRVLLSSLQFLHV